MKAWFTAGDQMVQKIGGKSFMKSNIKTVIVMAFILAILLSPTSCAIDKASTNAEGVALFIETHRGSIEIIVQNPGNESINYSFYVIYCRPITWRELPGYISVNGSIAPNGTISQKYPVDHRFARVFAILAADDTILVCSGFVILEHIIFTITTTTHYTEEDY